MAIPNNLAWNAEVLPNEAALLEETLKREIADTNAEIALRNELVSDQQFMEDSEKSRDAANYVLSSIQYNPYTTQDQIDQVTLATLEYDDATKQFADAKANEQAAVERKKGADTIMAGVFST